MMGFHCSASSKPEAQQIKYFFLLHLLPESKAIAEALLFIQAHRDLDICA